MTISVWRYSHLALAVSSFLFILLASLTGIILAFEPISHKIQPYESAQFNQISIGEMLTSLKKNNEEVIDVSIDKNNFVIVKAIDADGKNTEFYANPKTGKFIAKKEKENPFFQWVTTLHRSLFLHEIGRLFIGIASFLLFLIAVSGTILIIQRQRGFKRFFAKIVKENFAQYYHVVLGRLALIPIIIISITGVYLTLVKFEIFKEQKISHKINYDAIKSEPKKNLTDFAIFKNTPISDVQNIEFPFSDDVEDYFTVKLKDRELVVNQFTGEILSEVLYNKTTNFSNLSLNLHTGRASAIWAIILAIACVNILFFVYSGFAMTLKRRKNQIKNKFKKEEANFIILVGSENGSTFRFANIVHEQLLKNGKKSFITELNKYSHFANAEHLLLVAATYGLGDAPTNASKFVNLLKENPQSKPINYSVLAFGSKSYPDFCQFGYEVNNVLSAENWAKPFLEIHTVNDKSPEDFQKWLTLWSQKLELPMEFLPHLFYPKPKKSKELIVVEKTEIAHEEGAFLMKLDFVKKTKFTSGDLLSIYPANDHRERLYSIGKVNNKVQLSVKLHPNGLGSGYLYNLNVGNSLKANVVSNSNFHFPQKAKKVIMISNGTGIAPFLGMINQNKASECHLYCGFRGNYSFELYKNSIEKNLKSKKLSSLKIAYSREGEKQYVKDLVANDALFMAETLQHNGVIMICGSLAMQQMVLEILKTICETQKINNVSYYQSRNQLLMDCY